MKIYIKNFRISFIASLLVSSAGFSAEPQGAEEEPKLLGEVATTAAPLNEAFEVNAGAFGALDDMETPLVIQSYGKQEIHTTSSRTVADVLTVADPSVMSAAFGGGFDNFRLRGFAGDLFNTLRIDGLALAPHQDMPLELIERVDVLKGPAGFLYGFNSPGGTVNYLPKRPTKSPFTELSLHGSSLQGRYVAVDTSNFMANGSFGYRLNAGYEKIGSFNHLGDLDRRFIGLTTDFRFSDRTLLQINTSWAKKESMADPLLRANQSNREDASDPASFVLPPRVNRRHALSPSWFRHGIEASNIDAKFEYEVNDQWTAVLQGNFSRVKHQAAYNDLFDIEPDGNIGFADLAIRRNSIYDSWSAQGYVSGNFEAGGVFHEMFMGASHHMNHDKSPTWDISESRDGVAVGDVSVGNILRPVMPPRIHYGATNALDYNSNIQESSVFISDLITFNDAFQAMLGGRYIKFSARNHYANAAPENKNAFVPALSFIYRPSYDVMTYLSYARGLERGEYAPYNANNANQSTSAIESEQYEIGLKTRVDEDFDLGVAIFNLERDASYLNSNNDFVSSGRFQHRGIEINATAHATDNLTLQGNLAYMSTALKGVSDSSILGKRTEGVPRWKGSLGVRYDFPGIAGLTTDAMLSYVGSRPVDAKNSGFIPGYLLLNAGVSYETKFGNTPVTFRLQGKNLTDKYYYAGVFYSSGLEVGRGREIFLSTQFRF